jgi:hypothetical protein
VTAVLSNAGQTHTRWRESGKPKRGKPPVGTTFTFTLNEAASVTFSFAHPGRLVSGKCVVQTSKDRKKPPCVLAAGMVELTGETGKNSLTFAGRFSDGHKLRPGSYTVTITARGPNGRVSRPIILKFTIVQ